MKTKRNRQSTQELITLGMALRADRATMEQRIRGIFSRKSSGIAYIAALVLSIAVSVGCFTTACRPVSAEEAAVSNLPSVASDPAGGAATEETDGTASLLRFAGSASAVTEGDRITVTSADGKQTVFTVLDDGTAPHSAPIPERNYVSPVLAAENAARTAVTVFGDQIPGGELHVCLSSSEQQDLVYYHFGFGAPEEDFKGQNAFGFGDAETGTVLSIDSYCFNKTERDGGSGKINEMMEAFDWDDPSYTEAHTSEKALATAEELVRTCFPTGTVIPYDPDDWDGTSHTDGEQIDWDNGYLALVDAYIRMDQGSCYYARVAVPLEEGAEPGICIFSEYPLGWEYCNWQVHDPKILAIEKEEMEAIRNGTYTEDDGTEGPVPTRVPEWGAAQCADRAEELVGTLFGPSRQDWNKEEDSAEQYSKLFAVKVGAYLDDGFMDSDPALDPKEALAGAERGNVLRFEWDGHFRYGIYDGIGNMVYADPSTNYVRKAPVAEWMAEKPGCTCCVLTWDW